jgi:hypothetical protein
VQESPTQFQIATSDPDEAHAWLRSAYADHSARLSGRPESFRFTHPVADCGPFRAGLCRHTMTLHGDWEPLGDQLLFSHLISGRFTIGCARSEVAAGPGDVFSYDPDVGMAVEWSDILMAQVRMERAAFDRVAAELTGVDGAPSASGFELARPPDESRARHWRQLMQYVSGGVAANPAVQANPLVMSQVFRMIVATALETFPATAADRARAADHVSAGALRRAPAFVDERAGDDIDLTAIAEAPAWGPARCNGRSAGPWTRRRWGTCGRCGWTAPTTSCGSPIPPTARRWPRWRRAGASVTRAGSPSITGPVSVGHRATRCATEEPHPSRERDISPQTPPELSVRRSRLGARPGGGAGRPTRGISR